MPAGQFAVTMLQHKSYCKSLFSTPSQDRFFEATQEGEVLFFNYLQSLLDRNEVRKI